MTLILTLTPEREDRLLARQAQHAGLSLDEYMEQMIDAAGSPDPAPAPLTPQERIAQFEVWVRSHPPETPVLSQEATSREAI